MSEERRGPVLPDNSPYRGRSNGSVSGRSSRTAAHRSTSSGNYRRSSESNRRSTSETYRSSNRSTKRNSSSYNSRQSAPGRGGKKRKLKSSFYFLCFLAVWIVLLLIFGIVFLSYADRSLKKFERSQSTYAMEEYIENFQKSLSAGELPEGFAGDEKSVFEPADLMVQSLTNETAGKELTYEKDASSYNTEEPIYNLLAGGTPVVKVSMKATNARTVFGILTIMDWDIVDAQILNSASTTDYYITVLENYSVTVNDVPVGSEYLTGNSGDMKLFANASEYVNIPTSVEYMIPGLSREPVVRITDENGNDMEVSKDGTTYTAGFGVRGEMPEDLKEQALTIAETWSLFMTADLTGGNHGLSKVQEYLIPGSAYDDLAKGWAGGIDITFTSAHTLSNPAFENVVIDGYVQYTPECFACHIYFDKPMHLTRTGENIVDTTDSTYMFVRYDGKWCLVDMIASTEGE